MKIIVILMIGLLGCVAPSVSQSTDAEEAWIIEAKHIDPDNYYGETVANGMLGIVSSAIPMKVEDVVLNGVFDKYGRGNVENILKISNPLNIDLYVDSKRVNHDNITEYVQRLDMRRAVLTTELEMDGVHIEHKVRALRHLPFNSMVELSITPDKDIELRCHNEINSPSHLRDITNKFWQVNRPHVSIPLLSTVSKSPTGRHQVAVTSTFLFEEGHEAEPHVFHEDWDHTRHFAGFKKHLKGGETYTFSVISSMIASEHVADAANEAERLAIYAALQGREQLVDDHESAWAQLWSSDIVISGDPKAQRDVRNFLYHLYAFVRADSGYSLSPMGLSGLGYNGHVFWDTEIWMYPPLLVLHPQIAASLISYRIDRMDAARQNARAHGYQGVMYPWESAEDGSEQTPVWALTGPFQHHITADVAWAAWQYYLVTQDRQWLAEKGFPLMKECAAFWCSRVSRQDTNAYSINNVIGANEYQENINNNAYTNAIVKQVLEYTHQAAQLINAPVNPDWRHVAQNIPIVKFDNGVTRENATYEGEVIKQADVNLLAHPLYYYTDQSQIRRDLEYYEPRYDEYGPAMGFCTLATIHANLGNKQKAYDLFVQSYEPNRLPPFGVVSETKGGTNPYFITGAGGALQTVIFGFGGLRIKDTGIEFEGQQLPPHWESMEIKATHLNNSD